MTEDSNFNGTSSVQGGLYDVLLALKQNIFKSLKVGTLAEVKTVNDDNTLVVKPFPLVKGESEKTITCYSSMYIDSEGTLKSLSSVLTKNDIVLVVFIDRNFITAYKQAMKGKTKSTLSNDTDTHSENYGIVVSIMHRQ